MSGWRSGSGEDRGFVHPSRYVAPLSPRRQASLRQLVVYIVIAVCVVGFAWYSREMHRPPHRVLPAAIHPAVLVVPIGVFPVDRLRDLPHDYAAAYGLSMTIADAISMPAPAFDPSRQQYVAEDLIAAVNAAHPTARAQSVILIGVTTADLYIRGIDWNWAFALREDGATPVVSVARMPNSRQISRWRLFGTMVTRQVGFLCFGLPPSDNPYDVLYRDILSVGDLDRLFDQL
jgi:predicted Zn-dependent protease